MNNLKFPSDGMISEEGAELLQLEFQTYQFRSWLAGQVLMSCGVVGVYVLPSIKGFQFEGSGRTPAPMLQDDVDAPSRRELEPNERRFA
jgi:hypothetical protein